MVQGFPASPSGTCRTSFSQKQIAYPASTLGESGRSGAFFSSSRIIAEMNPGLLHGHPCSNRRRTGHIRGIDEMVVLLGSIGHFILIIACLIAVLNQPIKSKEVVEVCRGRRVIARLFCLDCCCRTTTLDKQRAHVGFRPPSIGPNRCHTPDSETYLP